MSFPVAALLIFWFFNSVFTKRRTDANGDYGTWAQAALAGLLNSAMLGGIIYSGVLQAFGGPPMILKDLILLYLIAALCASLSLWVLYSMAFPRALGISLLSMALTFAVSGFAIVAVGIIFIALDIKNNGLRIIPFM